MDTARIAHQRTRPDVDQESPHGCYAGWVYLGFETEEDGEHVEEIERVPCRRCADSL